MRHLVHSPKARDAEFDILIDSHRRFGPAAMRRYRRLLQQAYRDLRSSPDRSAIQSHLDLPDGVHLYPISRSRRKLPVDQRPAAASHIVAYRYSDATVEILDILHDRMDIPARLG